MARYTRILSAAFDGETLNLPVAAKISRRSGPLPAAGDDQSFPTSVQIAAAELSAEVRIRDIAIAEGLSLGREGSLSMVIAEADNANASRTVTLNPATLVGCELKYSQASVAEAVLHFAAGSTDGITSGFDAGVTP